jgi:hypothetical protein
MKTLNYFLFAAVLVITAQSESLSQWSGDPNNPMAVCNEPFVQREPAMISDGSGGYFVFWTDLRNYGANEADLYGQRLDAAGNKLWSPEGKKLADSTFHSIPKAVFTEDGNVIVLYSTTNGGGKLWAKKITPAGNNVWANASAFFIAGWPQLSGDIYDAVSDGSGGVIISYQLTWGGGTTLIFAQRIASNGALKWSPSTNGLNLSVSGESRAPVITSDERGGAHIFWYNVPGPYNIWKTHIDSSGTFTPKVALYLTPNNYPQIRAISDGVGGAVLAWATNGSGANGSDIYVQRINLSGAVQWDAAGVAVCSVAGIQTDLNIAKTSDGNYIIVWSDGRRVNINNDVYCQKLNSYGNAFWTPNGVLISDYPTLYPEPNLIDDNEGGAFIFTYNTQTNFSVIRIKSDSTFAWSPNIKSLASSLYNPSYHRFVPAKNGDGAIVAWETSIGVGANGVGIYGTKINLNGTLSISQISAEIPETFLLKQNYPNPFNPVTNLGFGISDVGFVSLKVYDLQGREVSSLVNEQLQPGSYKVEFDGSNFTSGIYFYRLITDGFIETKKMILAK